MEQWRKVKRLQVQRVFWSKCRFDEDVASNNWREPRVFLQVFNLLEDTSVTPHMCPLDAYDALYASCSVHDMLFALFA